MKKRIFAALASVMAISMIFASCTGTPATSSTSSTEGATSSESSLGESSSDPVTTGTESDKGQTLYVGTEAHGGFYHYMYSSSAYDRQVANLTQQRLVLENPDGIAKKNDLVVEDMTVSEDGLTYTFKLKENITFSDGTPLKADDVVFTYQVLADKSSTAYMLEKLEALTGIEEYQNGDGSVESFKAVVADDEYTVSFHFKENTRVNIGSTDLGILSRAYYPDFEFGNAETAINNVMNNPMGSGPYTIKEFAASQYVALTYNENFWADAETDYKIKDVVIKFTNGDTEMDEIITQSVDVLPQIIDKAYVDRVINNEDGLNAADYIELQQYKRSAYGYVGFNTRAGQASDVAVRQAVAYAFNREEFVQAQYGDLARTLPVAISQASSVFDAVLGQLENYDFDLEKAKEVLTTAGYTYDGDTCLDPTGAPMKLVFKATTNNPVINALVPVLSDNLKSIGIELDVQQIEFASLLEVLQSNNEDWDMFFMANSWTSDEPDNWYSHFHKDFIPSSNMTRYDNPRVNELLVNGRKELDLTSPEALAIYSEIAIELNKDMPEIPVYANTLTSMVNKRVKNLNIDTFQDWNFALEGAYIEG